VVTSVGTAAWHDFEGEITHSRFGFELRVCDTRVQGDGAERSVAAAIRSLGRADVDCVVVIRGGGARNELATFDAEPIALAIATSPVPVLTGLGHEIDRSVADEVAHTSYKTPTACARALIDAVGAFSDELEQAWAAITALSAHRLGDASAALLDRAHRVARRTHAAVERADERLSTRTERLTSMPTRLLDHQHARLELAAERLDRRAPQVLDAEARSLDAAASRLALLDPVNLLRRGWSISRDADGNVLRSIGDVGPGSIITTELADGSLTSRIEEP
ncbi:MAG: exodeoxyribonuclease VII large subunit, partial [Ilumatobacter sp.]|nr:exodeoxyribonuclease VII large subunit [Ilumatobacter sp.]